MGLESKNVLEKSLCVTSQEKKLFGFDQGEKSFLAARGKNNLVRKNNHTLFMITYNL